MTRRWQDALARSRAELGVPEDAPPTPLAPDLPPAEPEPDRTDYWVRKYHVLAERFADVQMSHVEAQMEVAKLRRRVINLRDDWWFGALFGMAMMFVVAYWTPPGWMVVTGPVVASVFVAALAVRMIRRRE